MNNALKYAMIAAGAWLLYRYLAKPSTVENSNPGEWIETPEEKAARPWWQPQGS
jgi:hypothetical protein